MEQICTLADLDNFDVSQLTFGQLKKPEGVVGAGLSSRPSRAQVRYKGLPLRMQTPMMYLPFKYDNETNNTSLTFSTRMDGASAIDRGYANAFNRVMLAIQSEAYDVAKKNSQDWFGKSETAFGESSDNFTYALREHAEGKYPPQMKVKYFRSDSGEPQFQVYDGTTHTTIHTRSEPGRVDFTALFAQGTRHVVIMDCMGIWCLNKRGGITWRMNDVLSYGVAQNKFPFANVQPATDQCPVEATITHTEEDVHGDYVEAMLLAEA